MRPSISPRLARGYARQIAELMERSGHDLRAATYLFSQDLTWQSESGRKIGVPCFNVASQKLLRQAAEQPSTVWAASRRATMSSFGAVDLAFLLRNPVVRLRGPGYGFESREWCLAMDKFRLVKGRASFVLRNLPLLIDQHLVDRYIERMRSPEAAGFHQAIAMSVPLATVQLAAAWLGGHDTARVVLPTARGVFLGVVEAIVSRDIQTIIHHNTEGCRGRTILLHSATDVTRAAGLRTFLRTDMLSRRQLRAAARLRQWRADHHDALLDAANVWHGHGSGGDAGLRDAFRPVFAELQESFAPDQTEGTRPWSFAEVEAMRAANRMAFEGRDAVTQMVAQFGHVSPSQVRIGHHGGGGGHEVGSGG
jgi:hypothetical protein